MKTFDTAPRVGVEDLIAPVTRAIKDDRVTGLAGVLSRLDEAGAFGPELFAPAHADHYTRRLLWHDPQDRFVMVAITWAPGQGSPLHDHSGLWGAEIVVDGMMNETMFELLDRDAQGRYRFARGLHRTCEKGAVGVLIPPLEYHDFGNGGTSVAHTVHVYGGDLKTSQAFTEEADGWWTGRRVDLRYDA